MALGSAALLTDFLGASVVGGRCRAVGTDLGIPTSVAGALDRRGMAGEEAPDVGPKESTDKTKIQKKHGTGGWLPSKTDRKLLVSRSHTSSCSRAQSIPFGCLWRFTSDHRFLSRGLESFLDNRAWSGNKRSTNHCWYSQLHISLPVKWSCLPSVAQLMMAFAQFDPLSASVPELTCVKYFRVCVCTCVYRSAHPCTHMWISEVNTGV